jgi:hypothetical protein
MKDLLNLASELMANDAYKSNDYVERKPDGTYLVNIDSIELRTSQKGNQWFKFKTTILDGEYAEQHFTVDWFLTEKTMERTIKDIMKLITSCGFELNTEMFTSYETLEECLQSLVNQEIELTKKTSKNNFINYSLEGGVDYV